VADRALRDAVADGRDTAALLAGLTTVTLWGSAFVGIRAAGRTLSPSSIAFGRLAVAAVALSLIAAVRGEALPPRRALVPTIVFGVLFLGAYSVTLNAAERHVDAGTSSMIVNTGPLLIAVLAGTFLGEGFPRRLLAGCLVALAGCVLIGVSTTTGTRPSAAGLVLLVLATILYAVAVIVQRVALTRAVAFQVTWGGCIAATLACLPFGPRFASQVASSGSSAFWTLYLGLMPTAVGFVTWSIALKRLDAGRAASLNYLIPVVAILLGWAYLHEAPSPLAVCGGALCLLGVYVARRR